MTEIVTLGRDKAIKAIENTETVYYKHGVWNPYHPAPTAQVIESIKNSGYGADVYKDEKGTLYVSIPCSADIW